MKICSECPREFDPTNNRQLACVECKLARQVRIKRERRQSNPEIMKRQREAVARYKSQNREHVRALDRQRYWNNLEHFKSKAIQYQSERREDSDYNKSQAEYSRMYRNEHGDELNTRAREKYLNDEEYREQCIASAKRWQRNNVEHKRAYNRQYYLDNYERFAAANLARHSRQPMDKELVLRIFEEDNYTCVYCSVRGGKLTIDHKIPVSRKGTNERDNLCTACHRCNCRKGAKTVEEFEAYLMEISHV